MKYENEYMEVNMIENIPIDQIDIAEEIKIEEIPEKFEITIVPERRVYPKPFAEYNDFGIFAVNVKDTKYWELIEENKYGNITLKGNMPDMQIGKTYITTVRKKVDPTYGLGYEVVVPPYMKPFTTAEEQRSFYRQS